MRFNRHPIATTGPSDDPMMVEAVRVLQSLGIEARRPRGCSFQLKVNESLSFYPGTGKIVPDGMPSLADTGLKALLDHMGLEAGSAVFDQAGDVTLA